MWKEQQENRKLMERALEYARKNLGNSNVSVEEVAREAGFSTNYFNRIFMSYTGFSVMEYIRFERLRRAAEALRRTDRDILEIALAHGYDSHEGFIRSFRSQYQCTPSEYREQKRRLAISWGEQVDETLVHRFRSQYPKFRQLDEDEVIDGLLARDAKRFGYLCTSIQGMGLKAVTNQENWQEGFVLIGDQRNPENDWYLVLVTDEETILKNWLTGFDKVQQIQTKAKEALPKQVREFQEYMYFGKELDVALPETMEVRRLTDQDINLIREWAGERKDGYTMHLLHLDQCTEDENVLEFGVFEKSIAQQENKNKPKERMIAAAGCGIASIHGFSLNDSIVIRFAQGREEKTLYRQIFANVTNELLRMGILPFDNVQYGEYAKSHGNFTSEEMGYELVNSTWFVERAE